jgi:hypothetical protein
MVGLVAAPHIGRELGPSDDLVDDGRHMVLPDTGAQKAQIVLAIGVLLQPRRQVALQLHLAGQRRRQIERRLAEVILRDLLEKLGHRGGADLRQHVVDHAGGRQGHPGMRSHRGRAGFCCHRDTSCHGLRRAGQHAELICAPTICAQKFT